MADLPSDVLTLIYNKLSVADLKRMTMTTKSPTAHQREALLQTWAEVYKRNGFTLKVDDSVSLIRVMKRFERWQRDAEKHVTMFIDKLRPGPTWASNPQREGQLCKQIQRLIRQSPGHVFHLDLRHFNGASPRELRGIYSQCHNLTHLALPMARGQDDLDVMVRGLKRHDALESLSLEVFFDVDRLALLEKLPKSITSLNIERIS